MEWDSADWLNRLKRDEHVATTEGAKVKINDGQLDHANREIETLRKTLEASYKLSTVLFDVVKEVAACEISQTLGRYHDVQIPLELWDTIREMTDESEVGT